MLNPFYIKSSFIIQEKRLAAKGKNRNRKQKVTEACFFRSSLFYFLLFFLIFVLYTDYDEKLETNWCRHCFSCFLIMRCRHCLRMIKLLYLVYQINSFRRQYAKLSNIRQLWNILFEMSETYQMYSMIKISIRNYKRQTRQDSDFCEVHAKFTKLYTSLGSG